MKVNGKNYRTIWPGPLNEGIVYVIDQNKLPFSFETAELKSSEDVIRAIENMTVRGAPLIGAAGAFGVYISAVEAASKNLTPVELNRYITIVGCEISDSRPTAVNLKWAVDKTIDSVFKAGTVNEKIESAYNTAMKICEDDVRNCRKIGEFGREIIKSISKDIKGNTVNILTHCNAGWLAVIDYGTALAPVYLAKEAGLKVHVWVEETRPRNQGARLTAWELEQNGIDYTLITDNAGGYVMQKKMADVVFVGSDRTTLKGEVCNKIGTYKTALAAYDNKIPFYAAVPLSSFDLNIKNGLKDIQIEERSADEIKYAEYYEDKKIKKGLITFEKARIKNYGFDITPSKYVTGIITERGVIKANEKSIRKLFGIR
jgi:methylthioribose-1-phosphate isomerase